MVCFASAVTANDETPPNAGAQAQQDQAVDSASIIKRFTTDYCVDCHSADDPESGFVVDPQFHRRLGTKQAGTDRVRSDWELAFKRIASRQMPPPDAERPSDEEYDVFQRRLAGLLNDAAEADPWTTSSDTLRRLTRTEYQNSIRDLLHLAIDATEYVPIDQSSNGFDNITVGDLSPALLARYVSAAEQIARVAVGRPTGIPMGINVRLPADLTQEKHIDGLPLGTRGGVKVSHTFAESGEYEVAIRLARDRDEKVEGLNRTHSIEVLLDRAHQHTFVVKKPSNGDYTHVDTNLKTRFNIERGPHEVAVAFRSDGDSLVTIKRQPFDAAYNRHRHPRQQPAIFEVAIVGPLPAKNSTQPAAESDTEIVDVRRSSSPSRQHLFRLDSGLPFESSFASLESKADRRRAGKEILQRLLRIAYRRPITDADLETPMRFFDQAIASTSATSGSEVTSNQDALDRFELGIENAIASILVNPHFLFRSEAGVTQSASPISDLELASRLSYFIWSSTPDSMLIDLAVQNELRKPSVLSEQVDRMLADPRAGNLDSNFAAQWLHLRNLDSITPDLRQFPDFDENLRRAFRRETELLLRHVMQNDQNVLRLIDSDFTFLNERLAKHYEIPGVIGSQFRRVDLASHPSPAARRRGGILRHGSILAVTSYATRTSPTIRGNWVLTNIVGAPPPPPPPNVPALKEKNAATASTVRERLARHRDDPACARCHQLIDPVGFAMDEFDAVGRWRLYDGDLRIDTRGTLPDGREVSSVTDLEDSLIERPQEFAGTIADKLLTFALGRPTDFRDAAAIRKVVADAEKNDFAFSDLVKGIAMSAPFQTRSPKKHPDLDSTNEDKN